MTRSAHRLPGPPELLPGRPDAVVDLRTDEGAARVGARWRYRDAAVVPRSFVEVGPDLGPGDRPNRTYEIVPRISSPGFDDGGWDDLEPAQLELRLGTGMVCFGWYRAEVTIPEALGDLDPTGATVVFEIVVDDYAEVWVDGALPAALGDRGGAVIAGFNTPNRVVLTGDARPGQRFSLAVFAVNGPISAAPANYLWVRGATLDFYRPERAATSEPAPLVVEERDPRLAGVVPPGAALERVAGGFEFTKGPVWHDGALLFSSPDTNTVYRWTPIGQVTAFRTKSGYTGADIGRYHQPGANGLTFDPEGRLAMCQHGNRQVVRVNPHGDLTVLADRFEGRRLNSPNDLVFRSDGTLYFTDPPFGLPGGADDPKRELPFSGVFRVGDGEVALVTDALSGPNGIALSPDERTLYVGDWDRAHKAVVAFDVAPDGTTSNPRELCDLTRESGEDAIDGIKVDRAGHLFVCGPGGVWVVHPDGAVLGRLVLPEAPHNLAWGDGDGAALYVTAMTSVYRVRLPAGGRLP